MVDYSRKHDDGYSGPAFERFVRKKTANWTVEELQRLEDDVDDLGRRLGHLTIDRSLLATAALIFPQDTRPTRWSLKPNQVCQNDDPKETREAEKICVKVEKPGEKLAAVKVDQCTSVSLTSTTSEPHECQIVHPSSPNLHSISKPEARPASEDPVQPKAEDNDDFPGVIEIWDYRGAYHHCSREYLNYSRKRQLAVFIDGSYRWEDRSSTCGIAYKKNRSSNFFYVQSFTIMPPLAHSAEAELMAIVAGLKLVVEECGLTGLDAEDWIKCVKEVVIYSDCQHAIRMLAGERSYDAGGSIDRIRKKGCTLANKLVGAGKKVRVFWCPKDAEGLQEADAAALNVNAGVEQPMIKILVSDAGIKFIDIESGLELKI